MPITANQNISFTYESLSGEVKEVESLYVHQVFTSKDGHSIVQGWKEQGEGAGRSYRAERMSNIAVAEA